MAETIGFIGLGVMGAPMARNLLAASHEVIAWNRSPGPLAELTEAGARPADGPAAVAAEADILISIVSDDAALRQVLAGPDGAITAARPGSLVIDMSTVSPTLARELAAVAADRDIDFLDAPVSGGDAGAREGTLSIMIGGEADALQRARPIFEVLGSRGSPTPAPPAPGRWRRPATRCWSRSSSAASPRRWCWARSSASIRRRSSTRSAAG
jgi:3-hydroxyisobutyrate dehydrogenase-like beta-hydroxyacid dehydrogenase